MSENGLALTINNKELTDSGFTWFKTAKLSPGKAKEFEDSLCLGLELPSITAQRNSPGTSPLINRKTKMNEYLCVKSYLVVSLNALLSFYTFYPSSITGGLRIWETAVSNISFGYLHGRCSIFTLLFSCKTSMNNGVSSFNL